MLTYHDLLFGLGLPGLVGTVLFLLAGSAPGLLARSLGKRLPVETPRRTPAAAIGRDASPFALVLGYLTAENVLRGRPAIPPVEAAQTLYFALLALALLSAVYECRAGGVWPYYVPISIVALMLPTIWLLVRPLAEHRWSGAETAAWIGGLTVAAAALTAALDRLLGHRAGPAASSGLVLVVGLTAIVLSLSGTKTYGQLAAAAAAALAPGVVLGALGRARPFSRTIAPSFVLLLGGLLLAGHLYASLTPEGAVLLLLAPLGLWVGVLPAVARRPRWQRGLVELAAVALPAIVAVGLAAQKFLEDTAAGY